MNKNSMRLYHCLSYAVKLKRLSTNFGCLAESVPSNLFICPSPDMCSASRGFLQTKQEYAKETLLYP